MVLIPPELLDDIERGNLLLFLGEGVTRGALPSAAELAQELAARCEYPPSEPATLPRIAGYFELTKGRHGLVQLLRERLDPPSIGIPRPHKLIARLARTLAGRRQPPPIVTTCYDRLLERSLRETGVPCTMVVRNAEVAYADSASVLLVWLWGVLDQPDSLVVTEDDRRRFLEGRGNLSDIVRGELARRTWLMIGFDAEDERFCDLYDNVQRGLDAHMRRAYLVGSTRSAYRRAWWQQRRAMWLDTEIEPFLTELIGRLAATSRPATIQDTGPEQAAGAPPPKLPYKQLDWYDTDDEAIFFGRETETELLSAKIDSHRLVLLYGASGTGKTSLLRAGVVPRLRRFVPPYEVVYLRSLESPALGIRQAIQRQMPAAPLPEAGALTDFLAAAAQASGHTLVIILDQFEGFFVGQSAAARAAFCAELKALHEARDVPVKVVLSLREDFRHRMSEIEELIPDVSHAWMRLKPLSRSQAEQAIAAPASKLGVTYDADMLEQLLADLAVGNQDGEIMPPELQLVCSALYEVLLQAGGRRVSAEMYRQVGGAQGVLKEYLEKALGDMGADRQLALAVLSRLVTSQGTRDIKRSRDLAGALSADPGQMERVLERLVKAQLVRPVDLDDGGLGYELRHEYILRSLEADTEEERQRKRAEELIRQEVEHSRRGAGAERFLLGTDKLDFIHRVREKLWLEPDAQELLLRSALQADKEIPYWLSRADDPQRRVAVLRSAAHDPAPPVRRRAAEALGTQDSPDAADAALELALRDPDAGVREVARASLMDMAGQRANIVARLRAALASSDPAERRAAWDALAALPTRGLPLDLRARIHGTRARLRLASWLAWPWATTGRRAVTIAVGLTVLLVALAYIFSASSYYLSEEARTDTLVIHRGFPKLLLPGLDQPLVNTGILTQDHSNVHVSGERSDRLAQKGFWGFWLKRAAGGYRQWGQDVADALDGPWRAAVLWDLDRAQAQESLQQSVGTESDEWGWLYLQPATEILSQIALANPEAMPSDVEDALGGLLPHTENEYEVIRRNAALALGEAASQDRAALSREASSVLLDWLPDLFSYDGLDYRVGHALSQLAATDPALAQQIVSGLAQPAGEDKYGNIRANAPLILGQVAVSQPAVLPQVVDLLIARLADQEARVRSSAALGLGYAAAASGEDDLAQRSVDALSGQLERESDSGARASQERGLAQILTVHPQLSHKPEAVNRLIERLRDTPYLSADLVLALGAIGAASGDCDTAEKISRALLEGLKRGQAYYADFDAAPIRSAQILPQVLSAANHCPFVLSMMRDLPQPGNALGLPYQIEVPYLLGAAVAADPTLVTPQTTASLIESVGCGPADAPGKTYLDRAYAAIALGQTVATNPEGLDAVRATDRLIEALTKCDNIFEQTGAAYGLGLIAQSRPGLLAGIDRAAVLSRLDAVAETGYFGQVSWDPSVLAHLLNQVTQASDGSARAFEPVFRYLTDPLESDKRQRARQALFGVVLNNPACRSDPACEPYIRERLAALAGSVEPHERIAANRTLAMLDIADLAREAAASDAPTRTATVSRLNALKGLTFFGEDSSWAAKQALRWLALPPTEQQFGWPWIY